MGALPEHLVAARRLYSPEFFASRTIAQLDSLVRYTKNDATSDNVRYFALTHETTVEVAWQNWQAAMDELHGRALDDWSRALGLLA